MNDPTLAAVLRLTARIEGDSEDHDRLAEAARRVASWDSLPEAADAHGLAPLVVRHFDRAGIVLPDDVRQRLVGLVLAVRAANRVHFDVLRTVLDVFDAAGIPVLVLKGAALAHVLYSSPDVRPLRDIDLLVPPNLAEPAQRVLASLGFAAPLPREVRRSPVHHHLPAATRIEQAHAISVEIHIDALTWDTPGSLTFDRLTDAPRLFQLDDRAARTLGHADMLYHLCRHTAEPAPLLRLIWVADVLGYAARYRDEIQWELLRQRRPFVINALSLLDLVTPMPRALAEYVTPSSNRDIAGVGVVCKPPGAIVEAGRPTFEVLRDVFNPSDWWLRLYYGAGERASLPWYRFVRHPMQMGSWLLRRALRGFAGRRRGKAVAFGSSGRAGRP